ncbi:MAG: PLP-dependent aminotransferase family protein [Solirubrobacteraceae bacterium]|nr:PLP-dependent aminotransferase family protein [Solirubrobacteraceae bacterium]
MPDHAPIDWSRRLSPAALRLSASDIREILKVTEQPSVISFAGGLPAPELFPVQALQEAAARVLQQDTAVQYSTTEGDPALRRWIGGHAGVTPDHVQIVSGSQQGLELVCRLLVAPGGAVVVENPTYLGWLQVCQFGGVRTVPVATDADGILPDALDEALSAGDISAVYLMPNFQNPTGRTTSLERREAILELAIRHGVPLIEDDPYGELRFRGEPLPSLHDLAIARLGDPDASPVIRLGTFSKILAPGLRVAWVLGPAPFIDRLTLAKQAADLHTSTLAQRLAVELLPIVPEQIAKVTAAYGERALALEDALDAAFGDRLVRTRPDGGMFTWLELDGPVDAAALLPAALEAGVAYVPGSAFHAVEGEGRSALRLSYSCATPAEIHEGIGRLAPVLRGALTAAA